MILVYCPFGFILYEHTGSERRHRSSKHLAVVVNSKREGNYLFIPENKRGQIFYDIKKKNKENG